MNDIDILNSNSNACLSILEVVLGIIDYKDKPKQQDRLKKFYLKLKLANTHKKKADLAYIMLAMLSDIDNKQVLNIVEKSKLVNAVNISKDKKFRDTYISYIKRDGSDKVKTAERCLKDFLTIEDQISKVNAANRNKKVEVKKEEPKQVKVKVKVEVKKAEKKKEEPKVVETKVVEPKTQEPIVEQTQDMEVPGLDYDIKENTETLVLPTEEEMEKLLDTRTLPVINTDDIIPVIPKEEPIEESLKSVNDIMDDILSRTYLSEEKKISRTKEEVINGIEDYINRKYRIINEDHSIPYEDRQELRDLFHELRSYTSAYYNLDTIENIIETSCIIKSVEENKYIDVETLMNLAINVHNLVYRRLLTYDMESNNDEYRDARRLIANINLANPIKLYESAYNIFFNYYKNISKEEQRDICVSIERKMPYEYKSLFDIEDAIPYEIDTVVNTDKIKSKINETVKHEVLTNNVIRFDDLDNREIPMLIAYATIYMNDKEVLQIYRALEDKNERDYHELKLRSEYLTKDQYDRIVKTSGKLQEWFASALIINKSREDSKLRQDIKNPDLLTENLIYVTRTILKEEPLFTRSKATSRAKKIDDDEVKDFYNSNRLKKVQVRVFNNWSKLPKLIILNGYDSNIQRSKKVG